MSDDVDMMDAIRQVMLEKMKEHTRKKRIATLTDHPDLKELNDNFDLEVQEFKKEAEVYEHAAREIKKAYEESKKKFWKAVEAKLVEKGIVTQEDVDNCLSLGINTEDGYIYKRVPTED